MVHYGWEGGNGWLMLVYMLLFWGGLLTLGFFLTRSLLNTTSSNTQQIPPTEQSALQIAQARYAQGEITRDQYLEVIQDIKEIQ